MTQQKRLMFIAWNWKGIEKTLNEVVEWTAEPHTVALWKDIAYDEFKVAVKKSEGTIELNPEGSQIIRINIKYEEGIGMLPYILKIIEAYQSDEQKVFLFLHRSDGFSSNDIHRVIQNKIVDKCFLFSNGRDFIYYSTQSIGLLGVGRRFHSQSAGNGKSEVKVADEHSKIVFQPYFDKVWDYYEHEFETKITEIRADLLYFLWSRSFPDHQVWSSAEFEQVLKQNELLNLRIKNLLDKKYDLTKTEYDKLIDWEKRQQKSFVFDDCRENMERINGIKEEYDVLHNRLANLFFGAMSGYTESKPIGSHIQDLSRDFDNLLQQIAAN